MSAHRVDPEACGRIDFSHSNGYTLEVAISRDRAFRIVVRGSKVGGTKIIVSGLVSFGISDERAAAERVIGESLDRRARNISIRQRSRWMLDSSQSSGNGKETSFGRDCIVVVLRDE